MRELVSRRATRLAAVTAILRRRTAVRLAVAALAMAFAPLAPAQGEPGILLPALRPPMTQPVCPGERPTVKTFVAGGVPVLEWRENLAFDGRGGVWVSNIGWNLRQGRLERYSPNGTLTATLPLREPLGLTRGPDGLIYAAGKLPGRSETLFRFDPATPVTTLENWGVNVPKPNGMAFDDDGNLYGSDHGESITKVRPDGTVDAAWTQAADVWDPNGLTVADDMLYANVSYDQRSPIQRVPLADPAAHSTLTQLSFGGLTTEPEVVPGDPSKPLVPKGLDDLTAGPRGVLYVTAFVTGELLRVDRSTGEACVLVSGLVTPTSVRFARSFGPFHPTRDLFVTEASGTIRHIHLP